MRSIPLYATIILTCCCGIVLGGPDLHVHDEDNNLGIVDVATGDVSFFAPIGSGQTIFDIAFDADGDLFGISADNLYAISLTSTSASSTFIGQHGIDTANALVFGSNDILYAAGRDATLYSVNPQNAQATAIGGTGALQVDSAGDLAFLGGNLYLSSNSETESFDRLYRVDAENGTSDEVGAFTANGTPVDDVLGLARGDDNVLYAVADRNVYSVDENSGALTLASTFAGSDLQKAFGTSFFNETQPTDPVDPGPVDPGPGGPNAAVPEPASIAAWCLLFGICGPVAYLRRRQP